MHAYIIYTFLFGLFFVFGVSQTFEGNMTGNNMINMEQFSPFQGNLVDTKQLSNLIATAMLHQAWNFEKPYVGLHRLCTRGNTTFQDASL